MVFLQFFFSCAKVRFFVKNEIIFTGFCTFALKK